MIRWSDWHREPLLVYTLIFLGWLYAVLAGPARSRIAPGRAWPRRPALRFYGGLALFCLAVSSPFERIASVFLCSAEMLLHLVVVYAAAPLVLSGLPPWMADAVLGSRPLRRPLGEILRPAVTGPVFLLGFGLWQAPKLCEWALEDERARSLEHAAVFVVGLLFWWPILSPSRLFPRASAAVQSLYLLGLQVGLTAVFTYLLMAEHAIYPTYDYAPRLLPALSALEDQRLAAVLLGVVGSMVMVGVLGTVFFRWARRAAESEGRG